MTFLKYLTDLNWKAESGTAEATAQLLAKRPKLGSRFPMLGLGYFCR